VPKPAKPVTKAKLKAASRAKRPAPESQKSTEPQQLTEPSAAAMQAELSSMDPPALTRRADQLFAQGHTGAAASYYRRALELDPDYAPALVGIGRGILRAEKYDDAMENATRALQHARGVDARPGLEAEAIYQIARVHLFRGELDAARRLFRQSISLPAAPPAAWFYLGEALWTDNSPAAREAYERYIELVPAGNLADRARRAIQ
jgi:tetratricopeptide (TPR) repeat protein